MGFPVGYAEVFFPNPFLHTLAFLGLLRNLVFFLFHLLGLSDFLETEVAWPDPRIPATTAAASRPPSVSALLIRDILPVAKFGESGENSCACACAVCLFEFSEEEEIRRMRNCKHIFHRACVDRWIDHDQKTCPLCRTPFVPDDMLDDYNQRLWAASGINEFYSDYTSSF
ncbi:hypothetical protein LR48_Vigan543s002200 [Vigna angularis]|uniref:E3 ubiquitin-protein n=2 Tax=Phaseolus angularis TaxID=3914 RepID=A0A0L9TE63_PHAAN|nr:brassinosteroid-responsive RING protein 1 [Vigna angularis]KAG2380310.1 E3 ubiquitin-protein [Vigna angularis]KOM28434.1 hypothetical protein LR48_Vigan543s002200 [Vigna angularis]BAT97973.1 hypothetical protein VIGAN_09157100 [Vigna angularis var. angularis]